MEDRIAKFIEDFEWMMKCTSMDFPFDVELEEAVCLVKDLKEKLDKNKKHNRCMNSSDRTKT